jgi:putative ABC transport system permease protein
MNDTLYLAGRYLGYNRGKTAVLVASLSLVVGLPMGLNLLVRETASELKARAESTPLLVGSKGSRVDLSLGALYFNTPTLEVIPYGELRWIEESGLARAIPLHLRFQAQGHRIVGTTTDYLEFRRLRLSKGRRMAILGECVLGARAARSLGAVVGDHVLSTPAGAFDVAGSYPLKMPVVGILAASGTPDDDAVFVDLKTAWVISGLAHGHEDMTTVQDSTKVLSRQASNVVAAPSVLSYTEITPDNLGSFHFHGEPSGFPLDAILAVPSDLRSSILLRGRFEERSDPIQIVVPSDVVEDLLSTLFSVRDTVVAASVAIGGATIATMALVFMLSIRIRRREIQTMRKIGGSASRIRSILAAEILLVVVASGLGGIVLTVLASRLGPLVTRMVAG